MTWKYLKTCLLSTVVFFCVSGLFLTLERTDSWDILEVPHMSLMFADTIALLAAIDCSKQGININEENPCDPWSRPLGYGTAVLYLGKVGLDISDSYWLGWSIVVLFWIFALLATRPSNFIQAGLILVVLVSPAVMLGAERANIDLFIFCLVIVTIWLVLRSSMLAQTVAGILVFLAAIVKLYPVAAPIGLVSYYWKHPQKRWVWITVLALFGVWIAFNYLEVIEISHTAPKPAGPVTFGGELLFKYFNGLSAPFTPATWLATWIFFLLITLMALLLSVFFPLDIKGSKEFQKSAYMVGLSIMTFCFVVTTNYDYRIIFFIFLFPFLFFMLENKKNVTWRWIALVTMLLLLFCFWREILPRTRFYYFAEAVLAWLMFVPLISIAFTIIGLDDVFREQLKRSHRMPDVL